MSERKTVDDGIEVTHEVTCEMEHYIPSATQGRMHMRMGGVGGDWSDAKAGVKGSIYMPIGSGDTVVTVQRIGDAGLSHVFTFDAQGMIRAAIEAFEEEMTAPEPRP